MTLDAEAQLDAIRESVQRGMAAACNDHALTLERPNAVAQSALRAAVDNATTTGELNTAWADIAFAEGYRQAAKTGQNTTPSERRTARNANTDGVE